MLQNLSSAAVVIDASRVVVAFVALFCFVLCFIFVCLFLKCLLAFSFVVFRVYFLLCFI